MAGYCEKKDPLEFSTEIEKWDQETPADGKEMAKPIEKLYNNTEYNKKGVEDVKNPEFDASGNASGITNFQKMIDSITSKMSIFSFFANLKTGLKYVLDVGKIVNNGTTTEAGKFVLDAIQANPNIAGTLAKQIQENASAISSLNAREKQLTLTMDKWMIGHQIKGWGLVIPIVVYEPTSVEVTASQYKVLDESGQWQNAGDPVIYNPSIGGYNSFIHLTAGGTYIDGHSYLCTVGMKLS